MSLKAQVPDWTWAVNQGGSASDENRGVATDRAGNIFTTGNFHSSSISFGASVLSSAGQNDVFVAKYDASGNALWGARSGGTGYDLGKAVATDSAGNVYVIGNFQSPSISFGASTLTSAGAEDIFVAKLNSAGVIQYEFRLGSTGSDQGYGIVTDGTGYFYITGSYNGSISFGSTTLTSMGGSDAFVAKYSLSGTFQWARSAGGPSAESPGAICLDNSGNPIFTGIFYSSNIYFGTVMVSNLGVTNYQLFTAKYDSSGNLLWAKACGGTASEVPYSITTDLDSNVYVSGYMSSSFTFGTSTLNTNGGADIFIAKYTSSGTEVWAKNFGGSGTEDAYAVRTDENNDVYIAGDIGSTGINFGSTVLNTTGTGRDIFIAKLTSQGNEIWATSVGGTAQEYAFAMNIDRGGSVIIAGSFASPSLTFGTSVIYPAATYDVYVAKISALLPPDICMVTVDSLSNYNMIYWDKTPYLGVDSFIVYRETTINTYKRIGAVHHDSLSMFIDTVRTLYFPNTGNPNQGTYKYKLQIRSMTGDYGMMGPWHKSIFVNQTGGVFTFNDYSIEGVTVPVPQLNQYLLLRDDNSTGNWNVLSANASSPMNDPAFASFPNARWRVETDWTINCDATRATVNTTRSNIKGAGLSVGIEKETLNIDFAVFPNPADENVIIEVPPQSSKCLIKMYDQLGKSVTEEILIGPSTMKTSYKLDLSGCDKGIYTITLENEKGRSYRKLVRN
ncbi:MAG: hypothetical protein K0S44_923 [Bacteroidetes bacterium]|jgi:hypothetical protein|nr:hypothetical protein [Bacteroidota bacterium]